MTIKNTFFRSLASLLLAAFLLVGGLRLTSLLAAFLLLVGLRLTSLLA